jgi:murein L,D-transpeptidase YafK
MLILNKFILVILTIIKGFIVRNRAFIRFMKDQMVMQKKILIALSFLYMMPVLAQTSVSSYSFIDYQRSFPVVSEALQSKEDTLKSQFAEKKLEWPARYIYIRSFKYDSQLEVWVKQQKKDVYKLFKTYKVCALAGTLGPKRMQGDYQVPEGFYCVNEFNPKSAFHLSLGLNYPNDSDKLLSDSLQPGGDIFIHGSCVTTGCIPIKDENIEELYILASHAKNNGQDFIPVHIYPVMYKNFRSADYLNKFLKDFPEYNIINERMRQVYYYFEKNKSLPVIMTSSRGEYILGEEIKLTEELIHNKKVQPKRREATPVKFDEKELVTSVNNLPVYPGGAPAFQIFLNNLTRELTGLLPEDQKKTFVLVEYIVTKEGKVILPKVLKGATNEMNNLIIERFEAMPDWTPPVRHYGYEVRNVALRLKQTIYVEKEAG